MIQNASQQRLELIARVFAETGVKRAFRLILALVSKHQRQARVIRLRGKWVPMDPRDWDTKMDMTISVGLGTGNRDVQVGQLMSLLQMDKQIVELQGGASGPLVTMPNIYAKLKKIVEFLGLRSVDAYYSDPTDAEQSQQPPQPDPKLLEMQAKMAMQQQEAEMKGRLAQQEAQTKAMLAQQAAETEMQIARWKAEQEFALEEWKAQKEVEMEQLRAVHRERLEMMQANADIAVKATRPVTQGAPA